MSLICWISILTTHHHYENGVSPEKIEDKHICSFFFIKKKKILFFLRSCLEDNFANTGKRRKDIKCTYIVDDFFYIQQYYPFPTFTLHVSNARISNSFFIYKYFNYILMGMKKEQEIFLVTKETPIVREEETEQQRVI